MCYYKYHARSLLISFHIVNHRKQMPALFLDTRPRGAKVFSDYSRLTARRFRNLSKTLSMVILNRVPAEGTVCTEEIPCHEGAPQ